MTTSEESALGVREKVLRKIYDSLRIGNGEYRSPWNDELYEIYEDIDIVQRIKKQRLHWLGHVARMDENTVALRMLEAVPDRYHVLKRRFPAAWSLTRSPH